MKTVIHVNQHIIKRNKKNNACESPLTVKNRLGNHKTKEVAISGPCKVVYRPDKPLSCGATCWVETHSEVDPTLDAKFKANCAPCVQANFVFDSIGYQLDLYIDGKLQVSECRDFGGRFSKKKVREEVAEAILKIAENIRKKY